MKFAMLFLILIQLSGVSCLNQQPAPSNTGVCQAQLYFADINTQGKVVTNGNTLIFIDDQQTPGSSDTFSIDGANVVNINPQANTTSIYTYGFINYRGRQEKHVTFRFYAGDCMSILHWPYGTQPAPRGPRPPRRNNDPCGGLLLNAWARHERTLRTDPRGELIISGRRISFGPPRAASKYMWDFRDIRSLGSYDPFRLQITTVEGSVFTFDILDGRSISSTEYSTIGRCIFQ